MTIIGIIGGGFGGMMTALHLIGNVRSTCHIIVFDKEHRISKGIAYSPYSDSHLLNVVAGSMSAFPDRPDHFLDWVMLQPDYKCLDRTLVSQSFLPRGHYGDYLSKLWEGGLKEATAKNILLTEMNSLVQNIDHSTDRIRLSLSNGNEVIVNQCVIATGNQIPRNPRLMNQNFYPNSNYFQNPWKLESVVGIEGVLPVLVIGNGLTMVDTVFGLIEQGFRGRICTISPNGFNTLPHKHGGFKYTNLVEELRGDESLYELVKLVNRHLKIAKTLGLTAEPIVDSLRPHSQKIWLRLTAQEKRQFMSRLRHLWGIARHRIPAISHEMISKMKRDHRLSIYSGSIRDMRGVADGIEVDFIDRSEKAEKAITFSRVINCTGPESDLSRLYGSFLKHALEKGIVHQDELKLGIASDPATFKVLDNEGIPHPNLYTLGSNLRGELWETTAVNEIRAQTLALAKQLANSLS